MFILIVLYYLFLQTEEEARIKAERVAAYKAKKQNKGKNIFTNNSPCQKENSTQSLNCLCNMQPTHARTIKFGNLHVRSWILRRSVRCFVFRVLSAYYYGQFII